MLARVCASDSHLRWPTIRLRGGEVGGEKIMKRHIIAEDAAAASADLYVSFFSFLIQVVHGFLSSFCSIQFCLDLFVVAVIVVVAAFVVVVLLMLLLSFCC